MTETTDPPGSLEPTAQLCADDIYDLLMDMATELSTDVKAEWRRLKDEGASIGDLKAKLKSDLPTLLRLAKDTEGNIDEHRIQRSGKAGAYALDLGAARFEIGRRLDCIRAATGEGRVP